MLEFPLFVGLYDEEKERENCAGLLIFVVEICKILHARKLCESSF